MSEKRNKAATSGNTIDLATLTLTPGDTVLLQNISWSVLEEMLDELGDSRGRRIAYDRGSFEIMSPTRLQELIKSLIRRMIEAFADELKMEIRCYGSSTWLRKDLVRGVEPDECFYIQNESRIRKKDEIVLGRDPPPDLVLEVDITRKSLDRLSIYAAMGVPEVWRYARGSIKVHLLGEEGCYLESEESRAFPRLPVAEVARFLRKRDDLGDTQLVRSFRAWVRGHITGSH